MKELDWTFDEEEFDMPLNTGDLIKYKRRVQSYVLINGRLIKKGKSFIGGVVVEIKKYNDIWLVRTFGRFSWIIYEKDMRVIKNKDNAI